MKLLIPLILFISLAFYSKGQVLPAGRSVDWHQSGNRYPFMTIADTVNISDFGAVADAATSNDSAFLNALNSLSGKAGIIFFPAGSYFFRKSICLPPGILVCGETASPPTLLFRLNAGDHLIKICGSFTADTSFLTKSVQKGESVIFVYNSKLFKKGDYIQFTDNDSQLVTSGWAYRSTGQICRIDSITAGAICLNSEVRRGFTVSSESYIRRLNMISHCGIQNIKIERLDTTTEQTANIYMDYAAGCRVKCIESHNCNYAHIDIRRSTNIEINGSFFHEAFDYGDGGKGYGVMIESGSGECLVYGNIFDHLRHSIILQSGANGNVYAYNYSMNPYWTAVSLPANSAGDIVLHGNYPYSNLFEGNIVQNIVIDNSHGKNGPYNTFFRNRALLYGIVMNNSPASDEQNFVGNEVTNSGLFLGNYLLFGNNHYQYGNNIKGSISPAGTTTLTAASLFLDSTPDYYQLVSAWPPIGLPNSLNAHPNEVKVRYSSGYHTLCSPDTAVSGIKVKTGEQDVIVFPNPVVNYICVETRGIEKIAEITISGLDSRIKIRSNHPEYCSTNDLNPGIYLLNIRFADGRVVVKRVVKFR